MEKKEVWKDIEEYEGQYQVSDQGRVRSLPNQTNKTIRILKPQTLPTGYLYVILCKDGKVKHYYIHRLVAQAFIPNDDPEHKTQCNHKSEEKWLNTVENLEWVSAKENSNWGTGKERSHQKRRKQIKQMDLENNVIKIWSSIYEAGQNGFNIGSISSCCLGKRKTANGYRWKYA